MTVLQLQGTKLEQKRISTPLPLVRFFLASIGVFFIVAMHYFQHNPGGSGLELSFNASVWIPFSFAIGCGLLEICRQKIWRYSRMTIILFSCCVLLSLPIFYTNADSFAVLNRLLTLWAGFLFFISLQQFVFTHNQRQRLLWFITIAVLIEAAFGWYQFLGLSTHNRFGYDVIANRPYGIFQQPNVMASFLATGLVIAAYLLARLPRYRGKWAWQHLIVLAVPVMTIPLLVVLNSRTGWLGAGVGSLLMLPYLYHFSARYQQRMWGLMLLLGIALAWQFNTITDSSFSHKARVTLESQRTTIMPQAYDMFTAKPLTGYGYGKFEVAYITQTALWHQQDPQYPVGVASLDHPYNELLYLAAEGGIVPLLGLIIAALAVLVSIKKAPNGTQLALVGLFFPIVLHTQLEYPFYHSFAHWIIFIILIFWVDNLTTKYHRYQTQYILALKTSAIALPIIITSFMITTLYSGWLLTKFETTHPVDINYLVKVNNPWAWQHRFEWDLHLTQLQVGIATDKPQLVTDYILWANQKAQTWPRPALYQNLILAYSHQGNTTQAEQVATEAQQLFPGITTSNATTATVSAAK